MQVEQGEIIALLGESGSGKTTLLRVIGGFERPDNGSIEVGTVTVVGKQFVAPEKRNIGMVFQDYALFPHFNIAKNIAFGLAKMPGEQQQQRVAELLKLVGLSGYEKRYPHELSGGQQQRIAIARALASSPPLLLLDEPFSNLDESLKRKVRLEIKTIFKQSNTTAIFVTHDVNDALAVADRIAVIKEGELQQLDTPEALYETPKTPYVAQLMHNANVLECAVSNEQLITPLGTFAANGHTEKVQMVVYPQELEIVAQGGVAGTVKSCCFFANTYEIIATINDQELVLHAPQQHAPGSTINIAYQTSKPRIIHG